MNQKPEISATIGDTKFGTSLKDLEDGDLGHGYFDAAPEGNYEGSLGDESYYSFKDGEMTEHKAGTLHAGMVEPDGYRETHGADDEYGFVRRPQRNPQHASAHRWHDVERN